MKTDLHVAFCNFKIIRQAVTTLGVFSNESWNLMKVKVPIYRKKKESIEQPSFFLDLQLRSFQTCFRLIKVQFLSRLEVDVTFLVC